jgi:hypothetical protein
MDRSLVTLKVFRWLRIPSVKLNHKIVPLYWSSSAEICGFQVIWYSSRISEPKPIPSDHAARNSEGRICESISEIVDVKALVDGLLAFTWTQLWRSYAPWGSRVDERNVCDFIVVANVHELTEYLRCCVSSIWGCLNCQLLLPLCL